MFFADDIIWDEKIKNQQEIIDGIEQGKAAFNVYLICVDKNATTQILSCYQSLKQINKPENLTVIGVAQGKERAFELLAHLLSDWQEKHSSLDGFGRYFK